MKEQWHFWGHWNEPVLFSAIFMSWGNSHIVKKFSLPIKGDMKAIKHDYYVLEQDYEWLGKRARESIEKNDGYLEKIFAYCHERIAQMQKSGDLDLRDFIAEMADYAALTNVIELSAKALDQYFEDLAEKAGVNSADFVAMMLPAKKTPLQEYFNQAQNVSEDGMEAFIKKFAWVGTHGLEGEGLTREQVLADQKGSKQEAKKACPEALKNIQPYASEFVYLRSAIMETLNIAAFSQRKAMTELGQKHGLAYEDVISLTWEEVIGLIDNGVVPAGVKDRKRVFGLQKTGKEYTLLTGEELAQAVKEHQVVVENDQEVSGMSAYPGKVTGIAKLLDVNTDVHKVNEGDIIIAAETTVDFVPAMTKAAAFVTNQGGITSHAAIVSREMQKPCVIGTQHATKIFKDGDLVEVDAEKGVVRKVEK